MTFFHSSDFAFVNSFSSASATLLRSSSTPASSSIRPPFPTPQLPASSSSFIGSTPATATSATRLPTKLQSHKPSISTVTMSDTAVLTVGSDLPEFSLPINGGGTLSSDDIKAGPTVVYFYPRDATPGCTTEAKDFRDLTPELEALGASVVGVSKDSVESHDKFVAKHELPFPLISDDGTLCEAFGVWQMKNVMGNKKMGIVRSTFIIKDGKVVQEYRAVKSSGHAAQIVEALKEL